MIIDRKRNEVLNQFQTNKMTISPSCVRELSKIMYNALKKKNTTNGSIKYLRSWKA